MTKIYLDDVRTPVDKDWTIVRDYEQFVSKIQDIGLENIELISLDHDLGDTAMAEWHKNVYHNYTLNYDNILEKTGMDCVKWLINQWLDGQPVVDVVVHSANAVGSANMMGYIIDYLKIVLEYKSNIQYRKGGEIHLFWYLLIWQYKVNFQNYQKNNWYSSPKN
jgi:hypothetical protein